MDNNSLHPKQTIMSSILPTSFTSQGDPNTNFKVKAKEISRIRGKKSSTLPFKKLPTEINLMILEYVLDFIGEVLHVQFVPVRCKHRGVKKPSTEKIEFSPGYYLEPPPYHSPPPIIGDGTFKEVPLIGFKAVGYLNAINTVSHASYHC